MLRFGIFTVGIYAEADTHLENKKLARYREHHCLSALPSLSKKTAGFHKNIGLRQTLEMQDHRQSTITTFVIFNQQQQQSFTKPWACDSLQ